MAVKVETRNVDKSLFAGQRLFFQRLPFLLLLSLLDFYLFSRWNSRIQRHPWVDKQKKKQRLVKLVVWEFKGNKQDDSGHVPCLTLVRR